MAVTAKMFGQALMCALNKEIDWAADAIKVALFTSSLTIDQDADVYFSDLDNEVAAAGGYSAGGETLGTPTIGYTAGTNVIKLDGDDTVWSDSTITARYAVIYDSTPGSAATNPLIAYVDFGADQISSSGTFTITWAAGGICTITAA